MAKIGIAEFLLFRQAILNHAALRSISGQPSDEEIEQVWQQFGNGRLAVVVPQTGLWLLEPTRGAKRFEARRRHKPILALRELARRAAAEVEREALGANDAVHLAETSEYLSKIIALIKASDMISK
ncbi:hypothetical protein [Ruegeria arenilitoris]|uniref:hypothetical protein n=1 Tax=Ruegeria arenilitoris TaxID=1173585 RepID=UPI00147CB87B|nr:hypothetical protein [Ruegeria arenilitoris]